MKSIRLFADHVRELKDGRAARSTRPNGALRGSCHSTEAAAGGGRMLGAVNAGLPKGGGVSPHPPTDAATALGLIRRFFLIGNRTRENQSFKPVRRGKMPRGGRRFGSGRLPIASRAPRSQAGVRTPLGYLLAVMRDPEVDLDARCAAAVAAAPYCHRRLSPTDGAQGELPFGAEA